MIKGKGLMRTFWVNSVTPSTKAWNPGSSVLKLVRRTSGTLEPITASQVPGSVLQDGTDPVGTSVHDAINPSAENSTSGRVQFPSDPVQGNQKDIYMDVAGAGGGMHDGLKEHGGHGEIALNVGGYNGGAQHASHAM
jgi:hypothetical protein